MTLQEQYQSKKCTPEEAVSFIPDHQSVFTSNTPIALFDALFAQRERFSDLHLYNMLAMGSPAFQENIFSPEAEGHITIDSGFMGKGELTAMKNGRIVGNTVAHFSNYEEMITGFAKPAYVIGHSAPMDEDGYFSLGLVPGASRACVDAGAKVILQVNPQMPEINTDYNKVHISEVMAFCEVDAPVNQIPDKQITDLERKIAQHIVERIPDGATLQLGVGLVPAAISHALDHHKDLGIHTEVFTIPLMELMCKGVVNNSRKSLYPGISISGFVEGSKRLHQFVHKNKEILCRKLSWVNDPNTIAQNDAMVSVNSCMAVDLRGQVCSEFLGTKIFGASGGQCDFVRGARKSKGGMSYIAMHSVVEKQDGTRASKISITLPEGSVVTTLRNDVMCIVTEYGVAELVNRSVRDRALALISIAHPDFREELTFQAKRNGLLT